MDPMLVAILVVLAIFFFFVFLLVRRTLVGYREGVERGRS